MTKSTLFSFSLSLIILVGCNSEKEENRVTPQGRAEYELARLKDPSTGEIPEGMRLKELAFASNLPQYGNKRGSVKGDYKSVGPYNVGGRTRAVVYDVHNPSIILAGAISGGIWRTTDDGANWTRTTSLEDHPAVSTIVQDVRVGKEGHWYYGAGEYTGNSASKSFSATYTGSGMYRSTDNGVTWSHITSTATSPDQVSDWSYTFRIVVDPSRQDSTVVLAATHRGIQYSNDGGTNWQRVLGGGSGWSDIVVSATGIFYASIESSATSNRGFWRSEDGVNWTSITPTTFPSLHQRTVIAIAPSNENSVYFLSETPGNGNPNDGNGSDEFHSIWKYTYMSGNGAGNGGAWSNRSAGLPQGSFYYNLSLFDGYCAGIAVKPDNENVVFVGGTNMFRSTNGFASRSATSQIGGYTADGYFNFDWIRDHHHPDMHWITFHPNNPDYLLCSTDGGLHFTEDCEASKVIWESYNNGFISSQFYAISVDKWDENTVVTGGLQDNGTWHTSQPSATVEWSSIRSSDGAYTAIAGDGQIHYTSTQNANIRRMRVTPSGTVTASYDAMPNGTSNYLFVHPFTLDPANENTMYLPNLNNLWVNTNLSALESGNKQWSIAASLPPNENITAVSASQQPRGVVYVGTNNRKLYKITNAHTNSPTLENLSAGIPNGNYTSCIAVDERNADNIAVIYSNYRVRSAYYSEDGGQTFEPIEGNLKGTAAPGIPPQFDYISDGPSFRWMEIIPINDTNTLYLLGTSIGLFSTEKLNGDSTVWKQEAPDLIGNVIVDMMEYRASDGFTAIGTHGNGVFTSYFQYDNAPPVSSNPVSVTEAHNVKIYPIPANDLLNLRFDLFEEDVVKMKLVDIQGRSVMSPKRSVLSAGTNDIQWNISELPAGNYFIQVSGNTLNFTKSILIQ